jgi:hypothetical protein
MLHRGETAGPSPHRHAHQPYDRASLGRHGVVLYPTGYGAGGPSGHEGSLVTSVR